MDFRTRRDAAQDPACLHADVRTPGPIGEGGACSACAVRTTCVGSSLEATQQVGMPIVGRRRVRCGDVLFRAGEPFRFVFSVRSGSFKTTILLDDGRDKVTGLHLPGELLGMDGLATGKHATTAVALEDGNACAFPFALLGDVAGQSLDLRQKLWASIALEVVRERDLSTLLASGRSEQRVAAFLLDLARRMRALGYSGSEFHLRMTRAEIASYLGLTVETVSRALGAFAELGVLDVRRKHVRILSPEQLAREAAPGPAGRPPAR